MTQDTLEGFLASPLQCRLWTQVQAGRARSSKASLSMSGALDEERLARAWSETVAQNEILRTGLTKASGLRRPLQVIREDCPDSWTFRDLSQLDPEQRDAEAGQVFEAQIAQLGLNGHSPVQCQLLRYAPERHQLILSASPLCLDASGLLHLTRALLQSYSQQHSQDESEIVQYADYAQYCQEELEQGGIAESVEYWQEILEGLSRPEAAEGRESGDESSFQPRRIHARLKPALWQACTRLAKQQDIQARDLLFTCWNLVLARLGLGQAPALGLLADARIFPGLESSLGLYSGFVPIHGRSRPHRNLISQSRTFHGRIEAALRHQNGYLLGRESLSSVPELPCLFEYADEGLGFDFGGGRVEVERLHSYLDEFLVSLSCLAGPEDCRLTLHFDESRLPPQRGAQLLEALQSICSHWTASPQTQAASIRHWPEQEEARLVSRFSADSQAAASPDPRQGDPWERVKQQAEQSPDRVALRWQDHSISLGQLSSSAHRWARYFRSMGVGPESIVGLLLPRSPELWAALLGIFEAGGAYLPLDPGFPARRLRFMLEDSRAEFLLTGGEQASLDFGSDLRVLDAGEIRAQVESFSPTPLKQLADPDNLAYLIYTSGSSGRPKGTAVTRRGLSNYLSWADAFYPRTGQGSLVHSSLAFDLSVTSLWLPLMRGQRAVILAEDSLFEDFAQHLGDSHDFSFAKMTPSHLRLLREKAESDASFHPSSRFFILGGEDLPGELAEWWRGRCPDIRIFNEYGPTETVVGSSIHQAERPDPQASVPIGTPIANTRLYLLDRDFWPCAQDMAGELFIAGAGVSRGYSGQPALTADRFRPDPYSQAGERVYRSGDLAQATPRGLRYLGRLDEQVKIRGHRVEVGEIELALSRLEGVNESAVLASGEENKSLEAFLVLRRQEADPSGIVDAGYWTEEVQQRLAQTLPDFMLPSRLHFLLEMPLTANGKTDRRRLAEGSFQEAPVKTSYKPPRNPEEEILASIWLQVLDVEEVGVEDNFFTMGGDSMRSLQVRYQAAKKGLHFEIQDLFEAPTIRQLTSRISTEEAAAFTSLRPYALISEEDRRRLDAEVEDAYPLSRLQMGTLYHSTASEGSGIYHNINSYRLKVEWNRQCFEEAARSLAARHPILRTSYDLTHFSQPLQLVHKSADPPLQVIDLNHLEGDEMERELAAWMDVESRNAFDWRKPPLLRFFVHLLGSGQLQFSLSKHHSILDGWSAAAMLSELFNHYLALLEQGDPFQEYRPTTQYRDFVALEQEALQDPDFRDYWKRELEGFTFLRMPEADGTPPQPDFPTGNICTREIPVSQELNARIDALARSLGVPMKAVLLAAHITLLSFVTGEEDVVTGLVSNGRPESEDGERALGLFLNSIPFRIRRQFEEDWESLAGRVFEKERSAFPYRRYPMLEIKRDNGGGLLFDTLFYFTNFHVFQQFKERKHIEAVGFTGFEETEMRFTSAFNVHPLTRQLKLYAHFRLPDFSENQVEAICGHYARILESLAAQAEGQGYSSDWLSPQQSQTQLEEWNGVGYADKEAGSVLDLMRTVEESSPDRLALWTPSLQLTHGALQRRANRWARCLRRRGAGPEVLVGICLERSPEAVAAILGVLKSGAAYVALDIFSPARRLSVIIRETGMQRLICRPDLKAELLAEGVDEDLILDLGEIEQELDSRSAAPQGATVDPSQLAYVLMTSGSSGRPKGVMVSHDNLYQSTLSRFRYYPDAVEKFLLLSPLYFDSSVAGFYWTLAQGGCLVLPQEGQQREVLDMARLCRQAQVSHLLAIPSLYAWMLESFKQRRLNLRAAIVAGEACPGRLVSQHFESKPEIELYNEYGPTEGTVWSAVRRLDSGDCHDPVPIGRAVGSMRTYMLNGAGQLLAPQARAEICIGGAGVARGYWGRPAETADRFRPDPLSQGTGARMYRSGDFGRWRQDGQILFEGRRDDEVKISGYRIALGEVESALGDHPGVEAAAALAVQRGKQKTLTAFAVLNGGRQPGQEELLSFLRGRLPEPMVPARLSFVGELPLLPNGKLNRRILDQWAQDLDAGPQDAYQPPQTPLEEAVAGLWAEIFGQDKVGVEDDFGALGGDSIVAVQLTAQLSEIFMCELSVKSVFEARTVRKLSAIILEKAQEAGQDALQLAEIWNQVALEE